jgi:hypothetical protein
MGDYTVAGRVQWSRQYLKTLDRTRVLLMSSRLGDVHVTVALDRASGAFGASFCSPRDKIDGKIGQAIAASRLETFMKKECGQFVGHIPSEFRGHRALCAAVSTLAESTPEFFETRQEMIQEIVKRQAEHDALCLEE